MIVVAVCVLFAFQSALLKFGVWLVSSESPNTWLRALAVSAALTLGVGGLALLLVSHGHVWKAVGIVLVGPFIVLKLAYGIGFLRALLLIIVIAAVQGFANHLLTRAAGAPESTTGIEAER